MSVRHQPIASFRPSGMVLSALLILGGFFTTPATSRAQLIFTENFNGITGGTVTGTQFQTSNLVRFGAVLPGWTASGVSAIHAGDLGGSGDLVPMFWQSDSVGTQNMITLNTGVAANAAGVTYSVFFEIAPAVYQNGSQATAAVDQLRFRVLNPANSAVALFDVAPGAWAGSMTFTPSGFTYTGDGSGNVRFEISTATSGTGRFGGAVNNFSVTAVPEPSTVAALGLGLVIVAFWRRRQAA